MGGVASGRLERVHAKYVVTQLKEKDSVTWGLAEECVAQIFIGIGGFLGVPLPSKHCYTTVLLLQQSRLHNRPAQLAEDAVILSPTLTYFRKCPSCGSCIRHRCIPNQTLPFFLLVFESVLNGSCPLQALLWSTHTI